MKKKLAVMFALLVCAVSFGQRTDTVTFFSQVFQQSRTIYIQTPAFFKYPSKEVQLPVIFLLDGQHDWFIHPLMSSIKYLQYTHEIPQAIVVIIPHADRNAESLFELTGEPSKLARFITAEVDQHIQHYSPHGFKLLVGHSFTASFALYAYSKNPTYFSAVIAHTPLYQLEELVISLQRNPQINRTNVAISTGGLAADKDLYHRKEFDRLKLRYPSFFDAISTFEADYSAHNAVPLVANPYLLTKMFAGFSSRYSKVAEVNEEYKLMDVPKSIAEELAKLERASRLGAFYYHPEIPELNGIASRYLASNLTDYAAAVYELGVRYFPNYFEFHLALYDWYLPLNTAKARQHLDRAFNALVEFEKDLPDQQELLQQIAAERAKNGW